MILRDVDYRGIATITLDLPDRHNAFDEKLVAALHDQFRDHAVRALVLCGSGPSFCAGADLAWMQRAAAMSEQENMADAEALAAMLAALNNFPKPTIALVHGAAYGGGVGLAACCDVVIASEDARFCLSEVRLGLIPAVIGPYVIAAMGARHARRYFQTGEIITAMRAWELGLVHEVVPEDALDSSCNLVLDALMRGAPDAQTEAKTLIATCAASTNADALQAYTVQAIAARRVSAEGRNGVAAFLAKSRPAWLSG